MPIHCISELGQGGGSLLTYAQVHPVLRYMFFVYGVVNHSAEDTPGERGGLLLCQWLLEGHIETLHQKSTALALDTRAPSSRKKAQTLNEHTGMCFP